MPPMQIEAQARSGVILAFRPRAPDVAFRPVPCAPGWVPEELGMVRAVLLAVAMAAGLCGVTLVPWGVGASAPTQARRQARTGRPSADHSGRPDRVIGRVACSAQARQRRAVPGPVLT